MPRVTGMFLAVAPQIDMFSSISSVSLLGLINHHRVNFVGVRAIDDIKTLQQVKASGVSVTVSVPAGDFSSLSATAGELFGLISVIDFFDLGILFLSVPLLMPSRRCVPG